MSTWQRPTIARPDRDGEARAAVEALVAELQTGWDTADAEIADRRFSADIAWGSPYGATVHGFETLFAIHQRLKAEGRGGPHSRYEIDRVLPIGDDVIVAHVARLAVDASGEPAAPSGDEDAPFSEMAMYVLVRRDNDWWLAAGQNTRMRPGGATQSRQVTTRYTALPDLDRVLNRPTDDGDVSTLPAWPGSRNSADPSEPTQAVDMQPEGCL